MTDDRSRGAALSPRMRDCLRLVWERQATSKEIASELGISKSTVDGYIADAVELLGARDRRDAAAIAFGDGPRKAPPAVSGGDPARVVPVTIAALDPPRSADRSTVAWPWRSRHQPRNSLLLGQTLGWIVVIAFGSLAALALATSIGNGLPSVTWPMIESVRRLTH